MVVDLRRDSRSELSSASRASLFLSLTFSNLIHGTIPTAYDQWSQIHYFDIHSNLISGTIPPSLCNWADSLRIFSAFNNHIHGKILHCLLQGPMQQLLVHDNRITGSLPAVGADLQTLAASNNRLKGPLPNLGQAAALQTCALHSNRFKGTLSALNLTAGAQTQLGSLTLHRNLLNGSLEPLSGLDHSLTFLTLSDNDFTGRVTKNGIPLGDATVMLQGNRLSCQLPEGPPLGRDGTNLVLPGNAFDGPPPQWVKYPAEPLCVWSGWQAEWVSVALIGSACLVFFAMAAVCALRARREDMRRQWLGDRVSLDEDTLADGLLLNEDEEPPPHDDRCASTVRLLLCRWATEWSQESHDDESLIQQLQLLRITIGGLAALAVVATVLLIPVPRIGANYFECGDPFLRTNTLVYLSNSATAETLAATSFCCLGVIIAMLVAWLHSHSVRMRDETASLFHWSREHAVHHHNEESRTTCSENIYVRGCISCAALVVWVFGILTVNCLTVLYLATQAMPEHNLVALPLLICIGGVTFLADCVLLLYAEHKAEDIAFVSGVQQEDEPEDDVFPSVERLSTRRRNAIIAAALLTSVFILFLLLVAVSTVSAPPLVFRVRPIVKQLLQSVVPVLISIANSSVVPAITKPVARLIAGRRGRDLSSAMVLLARVAGTIFIPIISLIIFDDGCMQQWRTLWTPCDGGGEFEAEVGVTYKLDHYEVVTTSVSLMTNSEACSGRLPLDIEYGRCGRSILGVWLPLLIKKALFAAFGQPAMLLLVVTSARLRRWLLWVVVTEERSPDGRTSIVQLEDEYLSLLTWIDVALVFGPFCPLLIALIALGMATNLWAFVTSLRLLHEPGKLSRACGDAPLPAYFLFSMSLFVGTACIFFVANDLRGKRIVVVVLSCCFGSVLVFAAAGRRLAPLFARVVPCAGGADSSTRPRQQAEQYDQQYQRSGEPRTAAATDENFGDNH